MEQNWGEPRTAPGDQIAASGGESAIAALGIPRVPTRKDNQAGAAIKEQTRRRSQKGKRGRGSERKKRGFVRNFRREWPANWADLLVREAVGIGGRTRGGAGGWCGLFPAGGAGAAEGDGEGGEETQ